MAAGPELGSASEASASLDYQSAVLPPEFIAAEERRPAGASWGQMGSRGSKGSAEPRPDGLVAPALYVANELQKLSARFEQARAAVDAEMESIREALADLSGYLQRVSLCRPHFLFETECLHAHLLLLGDA